MTQQNDPGSKLMKVGGGMILFGCLWTILTPFIILAILIIAGMLN